ncbi:hypothetical protein OROGR_016037 [Orobanche gracilis]
MGDRKRKANKKTKSEWPSIKPKSNLQINRLKDDDLITWGVGGGSITLWWTSGVQILNYFTPAESKAFINVSESIGFVHQGSLGPTKGEAFRDNDRISVHDPVLAVAIWEAGLSKLFLDFKIRGKVAVGLNPNIRLYRYNAGQRFGRHIDESVDLGEGRHTHYTLLIYLSGVLGKSKAESKSDGTSQDSLDPLVGGETVFYGPRNDLVVEVYNAGQRFGRHIDESVDLGEGRHTHYTLLIYLSGVLGKSKAESKSDGTSQDSLDPLVGGETVFYGPRNDLVVEVPPTEGMALLHVHGDKCMLHEARTVSKGIKYVLRSDVVFA